MLQGICSLPSCPSSVAVALCQHVGSSLRSSVYTFVSGLSAMSNGQRKILLDQWMFGLHSVGGMANGHCFCGPRNNTAHFCVLAFVVSLLADVL